VTRTGGIGDLLFIQPNIRHLKKKYPTCTIKFACGPQYHAMVETWDCVDELLTLPFTVGHLTKSHYHAFFEGVIERCHQAKTVNAYHLFSKWLGLNLSDEELIPIQKPKPELVDFCNTYLDKNNVESPFIIMQLRASSIIRTPRPELWKKLIEKLVTRDHKIIITDSPHAASQVDDFIKSLNVECQDSVLNFAHESETLAHSIALTSLAKVSVSTDSSLMHISASMSVPAFGLYLPFPASVRLSTYKNVDWADSKDAKCAPCFLHGNNPCPKSSDDHPICYDTIDIDECIEKIEGLI
jgi:ADP-heptose:LPS heptosyltransferase